MRILVVSATEPEIAPLVARVTQLRQAADSLPKQTAKTPVTRPQVHEIEYLITGVGMVATAAWCSRRLTEKRYDLALNFGVCGSFDPALPPGTVVHVVTDLVAEFGAEDGDAFLAFQDLGLPGDYEFSGQAPPANAAIAALPAVRGITVNTVHGNERSIAAIVERVHPQVESMEGAAFMCACSIHEIPFAQVRAVSNVVARRDRSSWQMAAAIENLAQAALRILEAA